MTDRPNFLFIITDQLRADHLGCYGNKIVRTSAIDSLAARGSTFERFYVASPVCQPNRATIVTGRMPSLHGLRMNGLSLSLRANTFPEIMRVAGWRTALIGKSHLQTATGQSALVRKPAPPQGFRPVLRGLDEADKEDRANPIYDQENRVSWREQADHTIITPFYGFDYVELCSGHGARVEGTYSRWLAERHTDPASLRGPENQLPGNTYSVPQAWRTRIPEELYPTSFVAERTIAYLEDHATSHSDSPFFVQCSFPDPHHPFTPPGRYWDMYRPDDVPLPPSFHIGNRVVPPHVAKLHAERDAEIRKDDSQAAFAAYEKEAREAIALTYGMIAMIDDAIARIVRRLDELGLASNTVIIFTSDHGDLMGDHQLLLKGAFAYQGLIRVPFIWVEPGGATRRCEGMFGTLDIATSILERARLGAYNGIQGQSLLPALAGHSTDNDRAILIEYNSQRPLVGTALPTVMRSLVTRRWRVSYYRGVPWGELYDLERDPYEMVNLWDDDASASIKAELTARLIETSMELSETSPSPNFLA